jgi:diaminopimelate decarboxylase
MSEAFTYEDGSLRCKGVSLFDLVETYGTPLYVYNGDYMVANFDALDRAFAAVPHTICFALKANSTIAIGRQFAERGAGADVVSGGELYRAIKMGIPSSKIIFAGVGKSDDEIEYALRSNILLFNVESPAELKRIERNAERLGMVAPISVRVNPDVDPQTHPYISTGMRKAKFGVPGEQVIDMYRSAADSAWLRPMGIQMHVGSQLVSVQPIIDGATKVAEIVDELTRLGIRLEYFDIGGGLGIRYRDEQPQGPDDLASGVIPIVERLGCSLLMEPGRYLVGGGGLLLTRVLYIKHNGFKKFIVVDAAMNDLIRPALYDAYHEILPVAEMEGPLEKADVVGPVCESGDFLAQERDLPALQEDDLLGLTSAGAYGFAMASNYNSRPRPAEILVSGGAAKLARSRETYEDLVRGEVV